MRTANREKSLPHKLCRLRQVYVHALQVQHLYSAFFQILFGIVQHQK